MLFHCRAEQRDLNSPQWTDIYFHFFAITKHVAGNASFCIHLHVPVEKFLEGKLMRERVCAFLILIESRKLPS